ncbi:MAG: CNNM domain-containing protein [Deltaproteobacteria bacterium]|nr:CNNM domain-containing protein [Deltaproteobacteria bacterium]
MRVLFSARCPRRLSIRSRRDALESLRRAGKRSGRVLSSLRENIDKPISAILILNTLANTAGAATAGALVSTQTDNIGLGLFSAGLTLAILFFAEVLPKTLGVVHANVLAPILARPIQILVVVLWPIVRVCEVLTRLVKPASFRRTHSEEDILSEARLAALSGSILPEEAKWMGNLLKLNDLTAREMMTPRSVIFHIDADMPLREVKDLVPTWTHSRVPVTVGNNLDHTRGVVLRRHVLEAIIAGKLDAKIGDLMRGARYIPESMRGHQLLKEFITKREHLFVVVDEFGGTEGLVTLEDVIESILGQQIVDEFDKVADMRSLARLRAKFRRKRMKMEEPSQNLPE